MPALPSQQPVAVRHSTSPTIKDHYPYSSTSGMGSNTDKGGNKQGAPTITTSNRNPNSMYSTMSEVWGKDHWLPNEQETTPITIKTKKVSPRPSTPHGNRKNFIERNKQSVQSVQAVLASSPPKSPKKLKDDSQSISPPPSLKQKPSTAQLRPVTPNANGQSAARPKADKKKSDGAVSTKSRRPTSPTTTTQSAHVRSHAASPERPTSGHGHSAHSRSHVRAASPEIALREEVKKLKRILLERDDWLREKEAELLDAEDIVDALQERVREVEARNRELQRENEIMRNYIEEEQEKKKATSNEPTKIINSVMNNIQRIRGESTPVSNPNSPTLSSTSSKSPSPLSSPKPSPVLSTSKSKELLKANNNISKAQNDINPSLRPRVVTPQTRGNLIPANKVNNQKNLVSNNDPHPPRPTAPSPAAMNRDENINGGFNRTEMLDRHAEMTRDRYASALDRKQAAALNVVMEESEDSDADEFKFETDDNNSDDQADSESDDRTESESEDDDASSVSPSGVNTEVEEEDDDEESFGKWSTHASSKHDLDSIVEEEDEDDDDDEFEFDEVQQMARQKNRAPFNPSSPIKNSSQNFMAKNDQYKKIVNNVQSVYTSSLSQQLSGNNNKSSTQNQKRIHQDYGYPHRDSMSSIKSDSSDDSTLSVLSSQNGSYPSSVTSPSSFGSNNDLYGQSSADSSSNKPNTKLDNSKFDKNGLNDNYPTSVSTSQHADHHYNNSLNCQQPNNNKYNNSLNSTTNNGTSNSVKNSKYDINSTSVSASTTTGSSVNSKRSPPNLVSKQFNPRSKSPPTVSIRPISPASSSRASTPSSNASTARAASPAYHSSSRASTPASESSRNACATQPIDNSSDKCSTAIPPPPPPPVNKDPFATLQHYLRLISENSVMENPLKSYDIKKVIDEGSSAKVFTAHPLSNPSEECAIKVVPLSYSLEFIFNEIYVLKNLKHKNIVDFKESFLRWDGKTREVWIAMEKCARGDVTSRAGKVNQREAGRIARDLLGALKHLHSNGVIHRDIKLSNILSTANNEIKLADFGISSLTPTSTTAMVGTIPYMAPDVVLVGPDRPYDTKVDIWSVGVCILELLTGKAAWGRFRDDEIMDKLRRGEMPYGFQRLRKKADIGWEAVDFLEKCFIKTPENRWDAEKLLEHPFITGSLN
ncbi:unnamed protein product [Rhizophagus irregularis]|uniref:Protein kinase domain-containing protein n=3 Tax=Rhizophagus irregularis TaxID=588596 RepID=A0A915ZNP6_9GLOM|nr:unnamed protein product [Rhizophagus irregularis]